MPNRYLTMLAATAAMLIATPTLAAVTLENTTGSPLDNQIYGIDGTGTTVYGSSPDNDGIANVTFIANTTVSIGAGFAQINDATPKDPDFYSLIINPDQVFDSFKYSTQLTGEGQIDVYYLLTGTGLDATNLANYTLCATCSYTTDNNNLNKLLTGGSFEAFAIQTTAPISFFEIKQMTFNGITPTGAVPEPATWGMMLLGFGAVGVGIRRRRRSVLQAA